jgi:hypothetical protein
MFSPIRPNQIRMLGILNIGTAGWSGRDRKRDAGSVPGGTRAKATNPRNKEKTEMSKCDNLRMEFICSD